MTASNVTTFPSARLKMATQLRRAADRLCTTGDEAAGDAFLLQLDEDGVINTTWLLDRREGRALRMVGVLELVKQQLLEIAGSCTCDADTEGGDDDGSAPN